MSKWFISDLHELDSTGMVGFYCKPQSMSISFRIIFLKQQNEALDKIMYVLFVWSAHFV